MINKVAPARSWAHPEDSCAHRLVEKLLDATSGVDYQRVMYDIGGLLAKKLHEQNKLDHASKICIVSTVEDADFLSKGVYDYLKLKNFNLYFVCMWNQREKVFSDGITVAPIIRSFEQPGFEESDEMIVVKSIISGSCVVKTNITALFGKISPKKIHVVSPVMHEDSEKSLLKEFPREYSGLFDFQFIAKDKIRDLSTGEVRPGIGGNVYQRLGFDDQKDKNRYYPKMVMGFMAAM